MKLVSSRMRLRFKSSDDTANVTSGFVHNSATKSNFNPSCQLQDHVERERQKTRVEQESLKADCVGNCKHCKRLSTTVDCSWQNCSLVARDDFGIPAQRPNFKIGRRKPSQFKKNFQFNWGWFEWMLLIYVADNWKHTQWTNKSLIVQIPFINLFGNLFQFPWVRKYG